MNFLICRDFPKLSLNFMNYFSSNYSKKGFFWRIGIVACVCIAICGSVYSASLGTSVTCMVPNGLNNPYKILIKSSLIFQCGIIPLASFS